MPIYEFQCRECGRTVEALRRLGQGAEGLTCPQCGASAFDQLLSVFAAATGSGSSSTSSGSRSSSCDGGGG